MKYAGELLVGDKETDRNLVYLKWHHNLVHSIASFDP